MNKRHDKERDHAPQYGLSSDSDELDRKPMRRGQPRRIEDNDGEPILLDISEKEDQEEESDPDSARQGRRSTDRGMSQM